MDRDRDRLAGWTDTDANDEGGTGAAFLFSNGDLSHQSQGLNLRSSSDKLAFLPSHCLT